MIKDILKKQLAIIKPDLSGIESETKLIISCVEKEIRKQKQKIRAFIGGSLAKKTLIKKEYYDVDIFLIFDKELENMSDTAEKILKKCFSIERIHGSRDYFVLKSGKIYFEFIPILKIKNPRYAKNITDLSPSHVFYVTKKINKNPKIAEEIMLAKSFAHACSTYGAESYIGGFSGYALECLIIYYKSFLKFIKEVSKYKTRIILDPEKHYKNKGEILVNINESKLASPIILVDPVFKERNVLASLNLETLETFSRHCKKFLKNPSISMFTRQKVDLEKIKKQAKSKKAELLIFQTKTKTLKYDVAGAKLKKFFNFLKFNIEKQFNLLESYFDFNEDKFSARNIFVIRQKTKNIVKGPPEYKKENVKKFKKVHKNTFVKNSIVYAREKPITLKDFLKESKDYNKKIAKDMGIIA
ncbi:hypothetical protein COV15_01850 [Candidatus Woesearchaeota archaeon CG10_big_fil_rev_8_21_14_0_10_34_12]|nr:MAG: hypothetical protein COV15_01850 [Candidatus Woesearchaeota archaeon CG10_big_fil_rev_8_21_14_0_10_34_12]